MAGAACRQELLERCRRRLNPADLVTLLGDLIRIRSVNPGPGATACEREIAAFVADYLRDAGIPVSVQEVESGRPNVIAAVEGSAGRSLLLETHLDTVEADPALLRPEYRGGKVFGRGACDAKGSLACMLTALRIMRLVGWQPAGSVYLAAVADEEFGATGVRALLRTGLRADGAIVGEPTGLNIVVAHTGCVRWRVGTRGRAAHSSRPEQGVNAIYAMARIIDCVREAADGLQGVAEHRFVGRPAMAATLVSGGSRINVVPEACWLSIDRRTVPGEDPLQVWEEVRKRLAGLEERLAPAQLEVEEPFFIDPALETPLHEDVVSAVAGACDEVLGRSPLAGASYGTDASKLSQAGIPTVVFGPGDIVYAHSPEEHVEVDQLVRAVEVIWSTILRFGEGDRA